MNDAVGETTQRMQALQRRMHERIGAWIVRNLGKLLSGAGGALAGALTVYLAFNSKLSAIDKAQTKLTSDVDRVSAAIATLATKDYVEAQIAPMRQWQTDHAVLPNNKEAAAALELPPHRKRTK